MSDLPPFAAAFEQLRKAKGVSPAQMARDLGEYEGNISRWRRGGGIELVKVRKLAAYFDVDSVWLEKLAGYGDSYITHESETAEAERQIWRSRYDALMEKRVPRWAWNAYMDACEALADAFRSASPGQLSNADDASLSKATGKKKQARGDPDFSKLSDTSRYPTSTQQFASHLVSV
jgi:transcriptional regulator with XRE-family HTH domain